MTIAKTTAKKQYSGDGTTVDFSFPYRFFADTDLIVSITVSGVETVKTLTTDYTVLNNGDETGGTVTMVAAPASGEILTILRSVAQTQSTDYKANDPFPAETHEAALDRLTLMVQELSERMDRALSLQASDTGSTLVPPVRASKYLAFDASGDPIAATAPEGGNVVSAFMATMLDDVDAATARTTIGAQEEATAFKNLVEDTTPQLGGTLNANGHQIRWSKGADVASAAALAPGADGNYFNVTGTTTITSISTLAGGSSATTIKLHFNGSLTLTHSASLVLPGGANITTAAGDESEFVEYAAGQWRCTNYSAATGKAVVRGSVIQVAHTSTGALQSITATIPVDDTVPQITEGGEVLSINFTPQSASSTILARAVLNATPAAAYNIAVAAIFDGNASAVAACSQQVGGTNTRLNIAVEYTVSSWGTSAKTFSLRAGTQTTTLYVNGSQFGAREYGGALATTMIITEIE